MKLFNTMLCVASAEMIRKARVRPSIEKIRSNLKGKKRGGSV